MGNISALKIMMEIGFLRGDIIKVSRKSKCGFGDIYGLVVAEWNSKQKAFVLLPSDDYFEFDDIRMIAVINNKYNNPDLYKEVIA